MSDCTMSGSEQQLFVRDWARRVVSLSAKRGRVRSSSMPETRFAPCVASVTMFVKSCTINNQEPE